MAKSGDFVRQRASENVQGSMKCSALHYRAALPRLPETRGSLNTDDGTFLGENGSGRDAEKRVIFLRAYT